MLRWLSLAFLLALAVTMSGCGGHSGEIPPTKTEQPKMTQQQAMEKAMQGMPPEMRKKMESQMPRKP